MKNTIKALVTSTLLLTSTFAAAQELTEEQKALVAKASAKATPEQIAALTYEQKVMIAKAQKMSDSAKAYNEKQEALKAAKLLQLEEDRKAIKSLQQWSRWQTLSPDALTGEAKGFAAEVFNQGATAEDFTKTAWRLRVQLNADKTLDSVIIFNKHWRFPFDVKEVRMVFNPGSAAVNIPVRRAKDVDTAIIIDQPGEAERFLNRTESGLCKMELKVTRALKDVTMVQEFDTAYLPKHGIKGYKTFAQRQKEWEAEENEEGRDD